MSRIPISEDDRNSIESVRTFVDLYHRQTPGSSIANTYDGHRTIFLGIRQMRRVIEIAAAAAGLCQHKNANVVTVEKAHHQLWLCQDCGHYAAIPEEENTEWVPCTPELLGKHPDACVETPRMHKRDGFQHYHLMSKERDNG